jgi:hypothetical protein
MAIHDVTFFEETWANIHEDLNLETENFKMALLKSTVTPLASDPGPAYSGGTTDYDTDEAANVGAYTTGGEGLGAATLTETNGDIVWDTPTDANWVKHALSPTDVRWGLLYADMGAGAKYAVAFVDLGSIFNMQNGDLNIAAPIAGWFTETDV